MAFKKDIPDGHMWEDKNKWICGQLSVSGV